MKLVYKEAPKEDKINPSYYNWGGISAIEYIEAKDLGFHLGNAVKYITRAGLKGGFENRIDDIRKAVWYLSRYVDKEMAREKEFEKTRERIFKELNAEKP